MRPGEICYVNVRVTTAAGAGVTGLTTASFTLAGWVGGAGATFTVTSCLAIGGGDYRLGLTVPATAGWHEVVISQSTNIVVPDRLAGEIEAHDADSIYSAAVVTRIDVGGFLTAGAETPATVICKRRNILVATVRNSDGTPKDLSGYTTWRFTVRKADGTGTYTLSSGITGTLAGVLTVPIPEDASFYADIDAAITAGLNQIDRFYDVIADAGGSATATETIARGPLTGYRYEGAP